MKSKYHFRTGARLALMGLLGLGGCSTVTDAFMVDSLTTRTKGNGYHPIDSLGSAPAPNASSTQEVPGPFDLDEDQTPDGIDYKAVAGGSDGKGDKDKRNRLQSFLIFNSDQICNAHLAGIMSAADTGNFVLSETSSVLSGLGAIVTGASTVRALAGAASVVDATRGNFTSSFYANKLAEAVVQAIKSARQDQLAKLNANKSLEYANYTVDDMLVDVLRYHQACSFYDGVVTLANAASRVSPSDAELDSKLTALQNTKDQLTAGAENAAPAQPGGAPAAQNAAVTDISQAMAQIAELKRLRATSPPTQ